MADKGVRIGITASDQTSAGINSAKQSVEGLNAKMKDLSKGMEGVNKLSEMMMGGGALAGVSRALKAVYQGAAECEAAFLKLNPEMAKAAGSTVNFSKSVDELKAAIGGLMNGPMNYIRQAFQAVWIDPIAKWLENLHKVPQEIKSIADQVRDSLGTVTLTLPKNAAYIQSQIDLKNRAMDAYKQSGFGYQGNPMGMEAAWNTFVNSNPALTQLRIEISMLKDALGALPPEIKQAFVTSEFMTSQVYEENNMPPGPAYSSLGNYGFIQNPNPDFDPAANALNSGVDIAARKNPFMEFLSGLAERFGGLVQSIASVQSIMDPFGVILQAIVATLQPTIDAILTPLIGGLSIIGQTIGKILLPVVQALSPIVAAVVDIFVGAYNFLLPVFNFLIMALVGAVNAINPLIVVVRMIAATFSWLSSVIGDFAYNLQNWGANRNTAGDLGTILGGIYASGGPVDWTQYQLGAIKPGDLTTAGTTYQAGAGGTTTSSGSATYQAKTINVVVNAEGAFISDLRDFALLIRNEITSAEALGY